MAVALAIVAFGPFIGNLQGCWSNSFECQSVGDCLAGGLCWFGVVLWPFAFLIARVDRGFFLELVDGDWI